MKRSLESGVQLAKKEDLTDNSDGNIKIDSNSLMRNNYLIKSVRFARNCMDMGLEAKVVLCIALLHWGSPVLGLRVPFLGPHFYTEVLGKQYEVLREFNDEKQSEIKVLVRLKKFRISCSKSHQANKRR